MKILLYKDCKSPGIVSEALGTIRTPIPHMDKFTSLNVLIVNMLIR